MSVRDRARASATVLPLEQVEGIEECSRSIDPDGGPAWGVGIERLVAGVIVIGAIVWIASVLATPDSGPPFESLEEALAEEPPGREAAGAPRVEAPALETTLSAGRSSDERGYDEDDDDDPPERERAGKEKGKRGRG